MKKRRVVVISLVFLAAIVAILMYNRKFVKNII